MKYTDLSDKAKATARGWWRPMTWDHDWYEHIYNDAVEVGKCMGITFDEKTASRTVAGVKISTPDIWFDLDQGGGACWSGTLNLSELKDCCAKIEEYTPNDESLLAVAIQGEAIYENIVGIEVANRLEMDRRSIEHHDCYIDQSISIRGSHRWYRTAINENYAYRFPNEVQGLINNFINDLGKWIHKQLKAESDHMDTDEYVEAEILANDPDYDEDGNPE